MPVPRNRCLDKMTDGSDQFWWHDVSVLEIPVPRNLTWSSSTEKHLERRGSKSGSGIHTSRGLMSRAGQHFRSRLGTEGKQMAGGDNDEQLQMFGNGINSTL